MNARNLRRCLREPIPEIFDVARYLDAAVSAHLSGDSGLAAKYFRLANNDNVREWLESLWGKNSLYVTYSPEPLPEVKQVETARMPTKNELRAIHERDGYNCRFCGIPVIRAEVRKVASALYPNEVIWGRTNQSQHAGFQALWAQYDHVVPHSAGGLNSLDNVVLTCAGCNYGKGSYRLEEIGLLDPREIPPQNSGWDGLERLQGSR